MPIAEMWELGDRSRMRRKLQSFTMIWKLGKARRIEMKNGDGEALKYLRSITNEGPYSGVLLGYIAHLLLVTRSSEAAAYIHQAKTYIECQKGRIAYPEYCSAYIRYLQTVVAGGSFSETGMETLSKPASPFVRRILHVVT
jgi:hypothetical protein